MAPLSIGLSVSRPRLSKIVRNNIITYRACSRHKRCICLPIGRHVTTVMRQTVG